MAEKKEMKKGHAVMISVPYQGHINPFVSLALKLASKGITITFVHLQYVHLKLSKAHANNEVDMFLEARQSGLDIRYTTIGDGLPTEYDRDLNALDYWVYLFNNFHTYVEEFVGNLMMQSSDLVPNMLVTDTIYSWSANVAKKFNLVSVSFWTEPALVFTLYYHWDLLKQNGHFLCQDSQNLEMDYVPGVQPMSAKDLMQALRDADDKSSITLSISFEEVKKADFILHNTVRELESHTLSALNEYQPTYAIGPINFSKINSTTVSKSMKAESDCTRWLDTKPPGSVLYVSFGSVVQTSKQVIHEVAHGLLLSGVNFIWVVRVGVTTDSADSQVLPYGFEDEVKDRGLIVPWCDQITVLSSPGVGGFLTHCGWNSIMESMWCGVPMICYPISYDQPTNRKLVVDDWKIGISLCDGTSMDRKEVAEKIRNFMSETAASRRMRQDAQNVKKTLQNAVEIEGSSNINFDQFLLDLDRKLCLH